LSENGDGHYRLQSGLRFFLLNIQFLAVVLKVVKVLGDSATAFRQMDIMCNLI